MTKKKSKPKTVEVKWTCHDKMIDANGEPLKFGESGPLDQERAQHLRAKRKCDILSGGGPDLADSAESADSAKQEPVSDQDEEGTDGTD